METYILLLGRSPDDALTTKPIRILATTNKEAVEEAKRIANPGIRCVLSTKIVSLTKWSYENRRWIQVRLKRDSQGYVIG